MQVKYLNNIRHPHLVAMVGFCVEPKCIIFEYMHNGSLREILFSSERNQKSRDRTLRWQDRIRIAHEVCSGLAYLHLAKPRLVIHGHLTTSNILLDRNLVAKLSGFGLSRRSNENYDRHHDIRAFGVVLVHLLTGRNWGGLLEEEMKWDRSGLVGVLDERAGQWPLDLAEEIVGIAMKCMPSDLRCNKDLSIGTVMEELDRVRKKADGIVAREGCEDFVRGVDKEESREVPGIFLCPIFQVSPQSYLILLLYM